MKNVVYSGFLLTAVLIMLMIFGIQNTQTIKLQELNRISNISIMNLGTQMMNESRNEEYNYSKAKQILQNNLSEISSKGSISAEVLVYDTDAKIIKIRYTISWKQLNGKQKKLELIRTVMVDEFKRS